jgi:hypothetical protein
MKGLAADIKVHGMEPIELAREIAMHHHEVGYDQIINEFDQWVHVSFADVESEPRGNLLTARRGSGGVEYIKGLI